MERADMRRQSRRRSRTNIIVFALILIAIGCIILARNTGIITPNVYSILISWQMLLIIAGLWIMVQRRYVTGFVFAGVGAFFLIPEIFGDGEEWINTYWPVVFVIVGIMIIVKMLSGRRRRIRYGSYDDLSERTVPTPENGFVVLNNSFGQNKHNVRDTVFTGARIRNSFGSTVLDLRSSSLPQGEAIIEIDCSFGGVEIYVPNDWTVINRIRPVLGGVDDKRSEFVVPDRNRRLILKGNVTFSGVEIKS